MRLPAQTFPTLFPATHVVGDCADCGRQVLSHLPHEHAHRNTNELCWPDDPGAALYCGRCSNDRCARVTPRRRAGAPAALPAQ